MFKSHASSEHHRAAAAAHDTAAHHHREAAHPFDQGKADEGRAHTETAKTAAKEAQEHTLTASKHSTREMQGA